MHYAKLLFCKFSTAQWDVTYYNGTRHSILGSDCMTLIVMHWLLSDCSLPAQLLLVCFLSALWPRRTKIDFFFEVCAAQTDRHTLWLLELLSEPKNFVPKSYSKNFAVSIDVFSKNVYTEQSEIKVAWYRAFIPPQVGLHQCKNAPAERKQDTTIDYSSST